MQKVILGNLIRAAQHNPAAWRVSVFQPVVLPNGAFNVLPNGNFEYHLTGMAFAVFGSASSSRPYVTTGEDYADEFKITLIPEPLSWQPLTLAPMTLPMVLHLDDAEGSFVRPKVIGEFLDVVKLLDISATGLTASFAARKLTVDEAVAMMGQG